MIASDREPDLRDERLRDNLLDAPQDGLQFRTLRAGFECRDEQQDVVPDQNCVPPLVDLARSPANSDVFQHDR